MVRLSFPFQLHAEPIDQARSVTPVASHADLLQELMGIAEVSRDEADALAQKIVQGQAVNVSAAGTGVLLYGTVDGAEPEEARASPAPRGDRTPPAGEAAEILERLTRDRAHNRLVRDDLGRKWYLYEFSQDPPRITDIRKDLAEALLEGGHITRVDDEVRRVDLPGSFSVYTLA